jgi:hypothetical protein
VRFEYDLSSAPVLKTVPDGVYLLKIISSKESKSKNNNDQIQWEYEIVEPAALIVDGSPVKQLFMYQTVTEKTLGFLRQLWDACDKLVVGAASFDTTDLYGCTFGAEIVKQPGTPEYPNEKNQIAKYFKLNNCPAFGVKG